MSIDIFSVKAIDNIAAWMSKWRKQWEVGVLNVDDPDEVDTELARDLGFLGYASQHYIAKADALGAKRAVNAYEKIMKQFEDIVGAELSSITPLPTPVSNFALGAIPNLHSLIPMSQSARAPVFGLIRMVNGSMNFYDVGSIFPKEIMHILIKVTLDSHLTASFRGNKILEDLIEVGSQVNSLI